MKKYTWTDGKVYDTLPDPFQNASPITEAWWTAQGGTVDLVQEPIPARYARYSKYKIQLACQRRGIWEQVKAAIAAAGMADSWQNIQDIRSDNSELLEALPAIIEAFGQETVDAVLEEAIMN